MLLEQIVLLLCCVTDICCMCPYIDAHWSVNYNRGLQKYSPDNEPEPPVVTQIGFGLIRVRWGHIVKDVQCVDRSSAFIACLQIICLGIQVYFTCVGHQGEADEIHLQHQLHQGSLSPSAHVHEALC